ncbi:growth arrest and DNA damage-inducible proteins-interacting protein 1 [Sinocyclocheilus anshuiensis]|uniref:Large ribosomal subunit protein mL64 n=1 Tax=Sinocyclocheilus anshuiensis TaxID=1608454 RepID=A0A671RZQ3_9TELE|nr:PREDICTED: growth arrest and DNA damage-inducible proteins-interacting protein 1-like [Sinocyclocheilus anshuiensis]
MAASLLSRRTALFLGVSKFNSFLPAVVQQTANYNPRPLWLNIKNPYIPNKESERTPEWQKTGKYERKLFGRYGSSSGVEPAKLWPSHARLEELMAEEKEWHPPIEVMLENIAARESEKEQKRMEREKIIAANMAKMPKMIADWKKQKREAKQKQREEKMKRDKLLAEARERFGYALDPRSAKFQEMVTEIEKEEKKKRKLLKRRKREEEQGSAAAESSQ